MSTTSTANATTTATTAAATTPAAMTADSVDRFLDSTLGATVERVLRERDRPAVGPSVDGDPTESVGKARCADGNGTLTHLFFSDDDFDVARAKAICRKCALRTSCLAGALEREEFFGVWGGELVMEGRVVAVRRRRGRPPKTPRPVLVVDEVPVPPHLVA